MEQDINLGSGSVSGQIPKRFVGLDNLRISVMLWSPVDANRGFDWWKNWVNRGSAAMDEDGSFVYRNAPAGLLYLHLLAGPERTRTEILELADGEHLAGVQFIAGDAALQIRIVDAETGVGIPNAQSSVTEKTGFYNGRVTTDEQGWAERSGLPAGEYQITVDPAGYLAGESEWVTVPSEGMAMAVVLVQRAAVLEFEMSPELKESIAAQTVFVKCRVTDIVAGLAVPIAPGSKSEEHFAYLAPEGQGPRAIDLEQGRYTIEYELCTRKKGDLPNVISTVKKGTVDVELIKGQTQVVVISE
jgi:hypothetical protein